MVLRLVKKFVARGCLAAGTCVGASVAFNRYENYYWNTNDPHRAKRVPLDNNRSDSSSGPARWIHHPETGYPVLEPTSASAGTRKRVVVLGSGWGARYFLEGINRDQYDVQVISPRNYFLMSPLLPSAAAGTLSPASICSPIRELISYKNDAIWWRLWYILRGRLPSEVLYYPADAEDIDTAEKIVHCRSVEGEAAFGVHYDKLVIAIGATTNDYGTKGVKENAIFMKEVKDGVAAREAFFDNFEKATLPSCKKEEELLAEQKRMLNFVVVGGGPTGVEVAAELNDLIKEDLVGSGANQYGHSLYKHGLDGNAKVTLIHSGMDLLNAYHPKVSKIAHEVMSSDGVELYLGHRVVAVEKDHVVAMNKATKEKFEIPCGLCVWATGVGARPLTKKLIASLGEAQSHARSLRVNPYFQVMGVSDQSVCAIGDCCTITDPKLMQDFQNHWTLADVDKSGDLTSEEVRAFLEKVRYDYPHANKFVNKYQTLLSEFDTGQKNGRLSYKEFTKMLEHIDSHHRSMPPTAQVAKGQGRWLAAALNAESKGKTVTPFHFKSQGQMAYVGKNVSIMGLGEDGSLVMGDAHITNLAWRAAYWSMLADMRTRFVVPCDWALAWCLGRDSCKW